MGAVGSKEGALMAPRSSVSFFSNTTQCDEAPPPPPPLAGSAEPSSTSLPIDGSESSEGIDAIAEAAAPATAYENPGPYEQASQGAKRLVMLDTHDGFRCDINKQLSPYMAVVHSFWLGTNMIPDGRKRTYTWLAQVADEKSLYMARCDPERMSCDGRIHRSILGGLAMCKLQLGLSPEGQGDQALIDCDFSGQTWTANLKYGSMGGGLMYGCNFYQAITPNFSMGGEGMYIGVNQSLMSSYLVKYKIPAEGDAPETKKSGPPGMPPPEAPHSTIIGSFSGSQGLTLNYKRVVTPGRVSMGAELQANPMTLESAVVLGAEFQFSRSKFQVAVDGNMKMQSVLEAKLGKEPGQPKLTLTADLDHLNDEMRFGYGLSIDG